MPIITALRVIYCLLFSFCIVEFCSKIHLPFFVECGEGEALRYIGAGSAEPVSKPANEAQQELRSPKINEG